MSAKQQQQSRPQERKTTIKKANGVKSQQSPKAKKTKIEKKDTEAEDERQRWAIASPKMYLSMLAHEWNLLCTCPHSGRFRGAGNRASGYLTDMQEILEHGSASYANPFGMDDREQFAEKFHCKLTRQEGTFFYSVAKASKKEKKPIDTEIIEKFLLDGPFYPVHVSLLKNEKDGSFMNGSERFPCYSIAQGEGIYRKFRSLEREDNSEPIAKITCGQNCTKETCFYEGCTAKICQDHGENGWGFMHERGHFCFYHCKCINYECKKVACRKHERLWKDCDVCRNGYIAECAVGAYNSSEIERHKVCRDCGQQCTGKDDQDYECEFYCCPACLGVHRCNDDPSQYY